MRRTRDH